MAFHRFIDELQIKNNRHGLKSNEKIGHTQSIGINMIAVVDMNNQVALMNIEIVAAARLAVFDV